MSYANLILYGAVLPSYDSEKKTDKVEKAKQDIIKADDPRNREKVRKFFETCE